MTLDELHTLLASWPLQDHQGDAPELLLMQAGGVAKPAKVINSGANLIVVLEESPLELAEAKSGVQLVQSTDPTIGTIEPAPTDMAVGYGDLSGIPT